MICQKTPGEGDWADADRNFAVSRNFRARLPDSKQMAQLLMVGIAVDRCRNASD